MRNDKDNLILKMVRENTLTSVAQIQEQFDIGYERSCKELSLAYAKLGLEPPHYDSGVFDVVIGDQDLHHSLFDTCPLWASSVVATGEATIQVAINKAYKQLRKLHAYQHDHFSTILLLIYTERPLGVIRSQAICKTLRTYCSETGKIRINIIPRSKYATKTVIIMLVS